MSLTQERINEIASESALTVMRELNYPEEQFITAHVAQRIVNLSLSRIREEQEPSGYFRDGWNGREEVSEIHKDEEGIKPLFTIPPAPECNCKELVEALEKINKWQELTIPEARGIAEESLAKHKASMGEKG